MNMKHLKTSKELNESSENLNISDVMYVELREKFFHLFADSFAHHEDDYPDVEIAVDDAIELVKEFIQKYEK